MTRTFGILAAGALMFASTGAFAAAGLATWDDNNDGVISNEEFMEEYDKDDKDFSEMDTNADGQVSRDEYRNYVFVVLDEDKDGQLNEAEYKIYESSHRGVGTRGQLPKPGDVSGRGK